jgi:PAS domain S-box-containing protein
MNLNKLFPRLTIQAKLAIAFALIAALPLALLAALTTVLTVRYLRDRAATTLAHDLVTTRADVEQALAAEVRNVRYIAATLGAGTGERGAAEAVREFLRHDSTLLQVKSVGADGGLQRVVRAAGVLTPPAGEREAGGAYYWLRAADLAVDEVLLLPVEVRGPTGGPEAAVAILVPLPGRSGSITSVVVGEARAGALFAVLGRTPPEFPGVTGLLDAEGDELYHSARKPGWTSLLAPGPESGVAEFDSVAKRALLSGREGTIGTVGRRMLAFAPLRLGGAGGQLLILYHAVPFTALDEPVWRFLRWVAASGALIVAAVLGLSTAAARQLTGPVYELRRAVGRLRAGETVDALAVETNDELEDLARDVEQVGVVLADSRGRLEAALAVRTEALQETSAELTDLVTHSADAIVGLDADGRVRLWNQAAERLLGHPAGAALGCAADDLLVPNDDDARRDAELVRRDLSARGEIVNRRLRWRSSTGDAVPVSVTATLVRGADGRERGTSLIARDVRPEEQMEAAMRRSERLAAMSVMAAGMAHEINNPLAVLSNRLELISAEMREQRHSCAFERDLGVLQEHARRLSHLTHDLLRLAREPDGANRPVDLSAVARRMGRLVERTLHARGIRLDVDAGATTPVHGNEGALETVCLNLLLNAADATPPAGLVTVRVTDIPAGVQLVVDDTGPGVPADLRRRIFEPFFTTKGSVRGTGLGLAVCRGVVERHGGLVEVSDAPGGGARFLVLLPAEHT